MSIVKISVWKLENKQQLVFEEEAKRFLLVNYSSLSRFSRNFQFFLFSFLIEFGCLLGCWNVWKFFLIIAILRMVENFIKATCFNNYNFLYIFSRYFIWSLWFYQINSFQMKINKLKYVQKSNPKIMLNLTPQKS